MRKESLKTRCKRWIGSITRSDRYTWTLLMSADFSWFPNLVETRINKKIEDWKKCIDLANDEELEKLWHEIEEYRIRKIYEK
jgi:hypothetical protein